MKVQNGWEGSGMATGNENLTTGRGSCPIAFHSNKREQEVGITDKASKPAPSDSLSPARLHLLKVLYPLQTVPPAGDQMFRYLSL